MSHILITNMMHYVTNFMSQCHTYVTQLKSNKMQKNKKHYKYGKYYYNIKL